MPPFCVLIVSACLCFLFSTNALRPGVPKCLSLPSSMPLAPVGVAPPTAAAGDAVAAALAQPTAAAGTPARGRQRSTNPKAASATDEDGAAPTPAKKRPGAKRLPRPKLDFDDELAKIAQHAKDAKKVLQKHMVEKRNAARRKSRLVKKASKLPTDDLYRIAVLKRVGQLDLFFGENVVNNLKPEEMTDEQKKKALERLQQLLGGTSPGVPLGAPPTKTPQLPAPSVPALEGEESQVEAAEDGAGDPGNETDAPPGLEEDGGEAMDEEANSDDDEKEEERPRID